MEIIKPGNIEKKNETIEFTCNKCGCIFKANKNEYKHNMSQIEHCSWFEVKCPYCNCLVQKDDIEYYLGRNK